MKNQLLSSNLVSNFNHKIRNKRPETVGSWFTKINKGTKYFAKHLLLARRKQIGFRTV